MNSGFLLVGLYVTYAAVAIAALAGWVMNIITIAHSSFDVLTGMLILRIVGIFVGPIGAILGWL